MAKLALHGGSKVLPKGLGVEWPVFDRSEETAVLGVLRGGSWWRGGSIEAQAASECGRFERTFAKWHDAARGLCVPNGTIALELALRAVGVEPGDEVIVPALSFVVSASAVLPLGAVPVFADADPRTYQPDPAAIEAAISPRTRAIVVVHFGGYPADLDRIVRLARKHRLPLIEDCAHAQGTQWRGRGVGSYGTAGTFSFQQSKAFTSGEGGIVITNSDEVWYRAYRFHNLGRLETSGFYDFHETSSNYRLTDLQGALLNAQFARYRKQLRAKQANQRYLSRALRRLGALDPLPDDPRITRRGHYFYLLKYDPERFKGLHREVFLKACQAEGLSIGHSYGTAINRYPLFQNLKWPARYQSAQYRKVGCPQAERIFGEEMCALPHTALLAERKMLDRIVEVIAKVQEHADELRRRPE